MRFRSVGPAVLLIAALVQASPAAAQPTAPVQGDIWQIRLGKPIAAIPDGFADFACGTDGGPPSLPLSDWSDYMKCRPEPTGWREVYFRYDDELEYWARANNFDQLIAGSGTRVYGVPVIMSALIDPKGIVEGLRVVNDPRDHSMRLADQSALYPFLRDRFERPGANWACKHQPLAKGESPVNGTYTKDDCTLTYKGVVYTLSARYLRRAGERRIDPHTGQLTQHQFLSSVRFEMHLQR